MANLVGNALSILQRGKREKMRPAAKAGAVLTLLVLAVLVMAAGAGVCALAISMLTPQPEPTFVSPPAPHTDTLQHTEPKPVVTDSATAAPPVDTTLPEQPAAKVKAAPKGYNPDEDTVATTAKRLSHGDAQALLSLVKEEEMAGGIKIKVVAVEVVVGSNGKNVAEQIMRLFKQKGYQVGSSIGYISPGAPVEGISTRVSEKGVMDVVVGNIK